MRPKLFFAYAVLLAYLLITGSALAYTMLRVPTPFIPFALTHYSYGMMAPYQASDIDVEYDVLAEGKRSDGTWVNIDLAPYLPYGKGEANRRVLLVSFFRLNAHDEKMRLLAGKLQSLEKRRGRNFAAVRMTIRRWPASPAGFTFLRKPAFITNMLTVVYP